MFECRCKSYAEGNSLLRIANGISNVASICAYKSIRQANIEDIDEIIRLIKPFENSGKLIHRSREQLKLEIRCYYIIGYAGKIIACAALHHYAVENCAEIACLAVHPNYQNIGVGDILLNRLTYTAKKLCCKQIFVLTTQTQYWFKGHGFFNRDISDLPVKKRELYNYQRNANVLAKTLS